MSARRWRVHSAGNFQLPSRIINNLREVSGEARSPRRKTCLLFCLRGLCGLCGDPVWLRLRRAALPASRASEPSTTNKKMILCRRGQFELRHTPEVQDLFRCEVFQAHLLEASQVVSVDAMGPQFRKFLGAKAIPSRDVSVTKEPGTPWVESSVTSSMLSVGAAPRISFRWPGSSHACAVA